MPTHSSQTPRTAGHKVLSFSAFALLLLTGCGAKEELPLIPEPVSASASATPTASENVSSGTSAMPNESVSAEASANETQRYSGGSRAPEGEYRAADEHGPAQNVPKPVEPEGMNEESEEGIFKFLGYWAESVNYGIQTGDFQYALPLIDEKHEADIVYFAWVENFYSRGGWVDGGLRSVVVGDDLLISHGEGKYTWGGNLIIQDDCNYLNDEVECWSGEYSKSRGIYFEVKFFDGAWKILGVHEIEGADSE